MDVIVDTGLTATSVAASAGHFLLDDASAKAAEEARIRYEQTMDVVDDLYSRHHAGNVLERAAGWAVDHSKGFALAAAAHVEDSVLRGVSKAFRAGSRLLVGVGLVADFAAGALSQAADDRDKGFDPLTSLGRNSWRGATSAAGGIGGTWVGEPAGGFAGTGVEPGGGTALGAIIGGVGGGIGGQAFGSWFGGTTLDWLDHPEDLPWNQH